MMSYAGIGTRAEVPVCCNTAGLIGLALVIFLCLLTTPGECLGSQDDSPGYDGTIIGLGCMSFVLDMSSGHWCSFERSAHPIPFAKANPDGTMIILDLTSELSDRGVHPSSQSPLVSVCPPLDICAPPVRTFDADSSYCCSIDFWPSDSTYLYCGKYRGIWGVFKLDSAFREVENISDVVCAGDTSCRVFSAFFLSEDVILAGTNRGILRVDVDGESREILYPVGSIACLSDSRRVVLVHDDGLSSEATEEGTTLSSWIHTLWNLLTPSIGPAPDRLIAVDLKTGAIVEIDNTRGRMRYSAAFSPDAMALAYILEGGSSLDPQWELWIYDFRAATHFKTSIPWAHGPLLWLPSGRERWPATIIERCEEAESRNGETELIGSEDR